MDYKLFHNDVEILNIIIILFKSSFSYLYNPGCPQQDARTGGAVVALGKLI
jgi:hypothetical protein